MGLRSVFFLSVDSRNLVNVNGVCGPKKAPCFNLWNLNASKNLKNYMTKKFSNGINGYGGPYLQTQQTILEYALSHNIFLIIKKALQIMHNTFQIPRNTFQILRNTF